MIYFLNFFKKYFPPQMYGHIVFLGRIEMFHEHIITFVNYLLRKVDERL